MAIRGLLDWNLVRWRQSTVFSLDLMKLAHYYKVHEHDLVYMLTKYESENYTSVTVNKDYEDYLYPETIMRDPKASYCGLAMSNGVYQAMDPVIENRPADTSIYNNMFKYYRKAAEAKTVFKHMIEGCHLRVSLDNTTLNPNWESQLMPATNRVQHFILHDKNLTSLKGCDEVINAIQSYYSIKKARFGFKYPIDVYTEEELVRWSSLLKSNGISNLYLYDIMDDSIVDTITDVKQQLTYVINNQYWTVSKFLNELPHIFLQGIYLSRYSIPILLKIEQDFLVDEEWRQFADFFNAYMKSCVVYKNVLVFSGFTYCKYVYLNLQKEEKVTLFKYIQDKQPILFDYLYGAEYAKLEGEALEPHMYTWGEIELGGGYGGYHYREEQKKKKGTPVEYLYMELPEPEYLYLEKEAKNNDQARDLREDSSEQQNHTGERNADL